MSTQAGAGALESRNPATLEPLGSVALTPPQDAARIVAEVAAVTPLWAQLRVADRARYLERAAQAVIDEFDDLAASIAAESGRPLAEIAALDPALIGAAQICDGPLAHPGQDAYRHEALFERGIPGEGELPLLDFLKTIPADVLVSPEVPLRALRASGVSIHECARRAVEGARRLDASLQ